MDTALLNSQGLPVEEITGGCFCCRFQSLMDAAGKLTEAAAPDVFIAEPVGSCTDLRAAVSYPLRRIYGDDYEIAPLSVLVDPIRASRILGLEPGKAFPRRCCTFTTSSSKKPTSSSSTRPIFSMREQLEQLRSALAAKYPKAQIVAMSARTGEGAGAGTSTMLAGDMDLREAPDVDYEVYAEGEALLGWLNAAARIESRRAVRRQCAAAADRRRYSGAPCTGRRRDRAPENDASPDEGNDLGCLNLVRGDGKAGVDPSACRTTWMAANC